MSDSAASTPRPLPWPVAAAALVAYVAIGVSSSQYILSAVWILAVIGSYVFNQRLTRGSPGFWTVSLLALTTVLLTLLLGDNKSQNFIESSALMGGELVAAIIAVQFWCWPAYGGERGVLAGGLSALVFLAASWTMEKYAFVAIAAPIYMALLIPALRQARVRTSRGLTILHFGALAIAITLGAGSAYEIRDHRSEITMWFMRQITPRGRSEAVGISQIPVLGATSNLQLSPARVLRVTGDLHEPHLRGITFDTYEHGKWGPTIYGRDFKPIPSPELAPAGSSGQGTRTVEITRLVEDFRLLVAPLHATAVALPRRQIEWAAEYGGPLRTGIWLAPPMTYQVSLSSEPNHQGPLCSPLTDKARARCLAIPNEISSGVRELAQQIVGAETDPAKRMKLIESYLKTHHEYSRTTDPGTGDPISNFILKKKAAHCEYFASAAVILLRCVNIPARYVAGYYAHELAHDGSILVRQRDGHAWTECWVNGGGDFAGWNTIDATPSNGRPDEAADPIPWWMSLWEWIHDRWSDFKTWAGDLSAMQQAEIVLVLAALAVALQWLRALRQKKQRISNEIAYLFPDAALAELAQRFERILSEQKIPCPTHRTWVEHLAALTDNPQLPRGFDLRLAIEFARKFSLIRFGRPDDREAIAQLAKDITQLSTKR